MSHTQTKIVFATQVVDPDDPILGATVPMIKALAERVDEVAVLADRAVEGVLPPNCRMHVFGADKKVERGRLFTSALRHELNPRPLAVVAHIVPLYAILSAPLARGRKIPLVLWFTHWKPNRTLKLASRLATSVVTVEPRSFPYPGSKVVGIGHGIDTDLFACVERPAGDRLRAVALGRTSPAKGLEVIAEGCRLADVELEVYGPSATSEERAERERLIELGVQMRDPIPYTEVRALLGERDLMVNNMREGALDKVVYEAASTCMPVLASNSGFEDILPPELRFDRSDPADLAEKLRTLQAMDRNAIGRELRQRVVERHSVGHWADALLEVARR